jgi:hypothetical protein
LVKILKYDIVLELHVFVDGGIYTKEEGKKACKLRLGCRQTYSIDDHLETHHHGMHRQHSTAQQNIAVHVSVARASCGRRCVAPPNALSLTVAFLPLLVAMKAKAKQLNSIALFAFTSRLFVASLVGVGPPALPTHPVVRPGHPPHLSLSFFFSLRQLSSQSTASPCGPSGR